MKPKTEEAYKAAIKKLLRENKKLNESRNMWKEWDAEVRRLDSWRDVMQLKDAVENLSITLAAAGFSRDPLFKKYFYSLVDSALLGRL